MEEIYSVLESENPGIQTHSHLDMQTKEIPKHTDPSEDGEEAKSDGGSCSVRALSQRQLIGRGRLPLIGQKTKANKPQEAGKT